MSSRFFYHHVADSANESHIMDIRPVSAAEFPEFVRVINAAAGLQMSEETAADVWGGTYGSSRTLAAFDGAQIVGGTGWDLLELTLPGSVTARAARVKATGVLPTHRRRGVLTALMSCLIGEVRQSGDPLSILYASEAGIYGRFGYGPGTFAVKVEVDRTYTLLQPIASASWDLRLLEPEAAGALLPGLFDEHRLTQPGQVERSSHFWQGWFEDRERHRRGAGPRFIAVCSDVDGSPRGYVCYRFTGNYPPTVERALIVDELIASNADARRALWSYCLSVDLVGSIRCSNAPHPESLRWMLSDQRQLVIEGVDDFMWLRLVDLPTALCARRYPTVGSLVLEVSDAALPGNAGRYFLEAHPDGAACRKTDRSADIALGISELSAAYLGGVRFRTLADAGRITVFNDDAVGRADILFLSDPAPWTVTDW
jgi:predicted acetyltransferase